MPRVTGTSVLLIGLAGAALAQEAPSGFPCMKPDSVAFRGNSRVTEAALRGDVGIGPGSTLNSRSLLRAVKDLYATQQFDDVSVDCHLVANRPMIVFTVVERPLLGDVDVRGASRVQPGTVRDQVDILIGRPVDPAQISKVVARIDSLYEAKGYYLADVRAETTHVDAGTKITFAVDEGRRLAVSGVRISGNKAINAKTLVAAMETRPEGFLWYKKGEFDDDKYTADLTEKLPSEYAKHGFIDMQLARDTLIVDRRRGKALVDLVVEEGQQYVVGDFEVTGARRFNDTEIKRFYPFADRGRTLKETLADATKVLRRGAPSDPENVFDQSRWEAASQLVRDAYANEGYIHARLQPVVERTRRGADSVPTVNLRWDIDESSPAIVNRVDIVGNDITTESCIRDQILVVPGDVFNRELLMRSYQSLSQMQFFESPLPGPDTKLDEKGDIDIIFNVKEKKTGNVNFGASVGQGTGIGGFIGFEQPNLFGLCKRASMQWQYGKYVNDFNLSYTDPRIRESRVSGTVTAYHTQSRFIIGNLGRQTRAGGQLRFGFQVPRTRWTRLFLEYGGESVKYGEGAVTSFINCGSGRTCFRSSAGATLDRDTRIDMPFPSQGSHESISMQLNGGPLGGTAAFQRFTAEMRGYTTIAQFGGKAVGSQKLKVVTGISTKLGAVFGDPGPFFVYQSFALGGVQYGEQLRGYPEFSISPNGYIGEVTGNTQAQTQSFGTTFFTSSAELGLRVSQQLYLSSFMDVGNLWLRPRDFNPTRLFRGAGVGAALVTPLGPLGLDVAYGFDRKDAAGVNSAKWQVHFKFGQFF